MAETYQVLARKWRPQQFDDVIGQEHVTRTLKNAITEDRVAHAYLLVGPRGTGKTSTARILAKALNCEQGPTVTPCDACDSCREIMAGRSMDVLEIDAASNTGVDHVRDLRDSARYTPARGPYKVYVIDEVHMLSTGAFNALLKTLEEPPPHVKFVLATTDPQKVPATILSRCQRFDLRRIAPPVMAAALEKIAAAEQIDVDADARLAIARGAEGGMRDALSALDQLISFVGPTIREDDVLAVFGLVSRSALEELAGAVLAGDVPEIIRQVGRLDETGKDMQRLVFELLEHFRNVLIAMHASDAAAALELTEAQQQVLMRQAKQTSPGRGLQIVDLLTQAEGRLRYALSRRTLVEVALIRAARAATVVSLDELLTQLNELKARLGEPLEEAVSDTAKKKSPDPVVTAAEKASGPASAPAPQPEREPQPSSQPAPEADPEPEPESEPVEQAARTDLADAPDLDDEPEPTACEVEVEELDDLDEPEPEISDEASAGPDDEELPALPSPGDMQRWMHEPAVRLVLESLNGHIKEIHAHQKGSKKR
jgi:DNA polymerase-3 subunit gamma/tau